MKSDMNKKRLAICAIYDKYGIIDESILYLLREMRAISTHLLAVCNGVIEEKSVKILRSYVDKVYLRDNSGFDVEAYKYVLENCLGWDIVHEYDELILFNTTFFGPFCSMQTIFDVMDFKALDFWGLTEHGAMRVGECQINTHVQSYFLVITSRLLHSEDFSIFWESRKKGLDDINEVINDFELSLTSILEQKGYRWGTYVNTTNLEGLDIENNFNPLVYLPNTLLQHYGLPILKKRLWPWTNTEKTLGNELRDALTYIDECTSYDVNIIWKYMIRHLDINALQKALHLHFVIPYQASVKKYMKRVLKKPAVIIFIPDEKTAKKICNGQIKIPENCNKYFLTITPEVERILVEDYVSEVQVRLTEPSNVGMSFIRWTQELSKQYIYVCFCTLQIVCGNRTPEQMSHNYNIHENLLKNEQYVKNVLQIFEDNPYLGVLCLPIPYHSEYMRGKSNEWYYEYWEIERLMRCLELRCQCSIESETPIMEFSFWFRMEALRGLLDAEEVLNEYTNENLISDIMLPRIIPYVAQNEGYYTGIVENIDFAGLHLDGQQYLLEENYMHKQRDEQLKGLLDFCRAYSELYIYGAGKYGMQAAELLKKHNIRPSGFVVSHNHWKENQGRDTEYPIYSLQNLRIDAGVVVALNALNASEAMEELKHCGMKHVWLWNHTIG